jgi:hypothetical protein
MLSAAWVAQDAAAQPREHRDRKDRIDKVERLKQMRLIEELALGEEESVRFMAKRREHEERMKALAEERNAILDGLSAMLEGEPGGRSGAKPGAKPGEPAPELEKELARVLEQDRKMFEERKQYQEEMRKLLPAGKFARMLIFERDFQTQVRNAMGQSMKRKSSKFGD